jgi:hypothetical protein
MDPEERDALFEDSVSPFLDNPDDAKWLVSNVRERVKAEFPDLPLSQPAAGNLTTTVTNDNARVEGNAWRAIKVNALIACC